MPSHSLPARPGALHLSVCGIGFRLSPLEPGLLRDLGRRFSPFVVTEAENPPNGPAPARVDLDIEVLRSDATGFLPKPSPDGSLLYRIETRVRDDRVHAWSYAFSGRFDLKGSSGILELADSGFEPVTRSVENFLRVALAWTALRLGRLMLHASGVVRNGRAFVFFGPSGAGKSTVVRLSAGVEGAAEPVVLNDDLILLHPDERGGYLASGVPFKGADDLGADVEDSFPLAGLFRLVQAPDVSCERLSAPRAAGEISGSIPFVTETVEGFDRVFAFVAGLARTVPVCQLRFRLAPDFWPAVVEAVRSDGS